jgi:hypothetical protein
VSRPGGARRRADPQPPTSLALMLLVRALTLAGCQQCWLGSSGSDPDRPSHAVASGCQRGQRPGHSMSGSAAQVTASGRGSNLKPGGNPDLCPPDHWQIRNHHVSHSAAGLALPSESASKHFALSAD